MNAGQFQTLRSLENSASDRPEPPRKKQEKRPFFDALSRRGNLPQRLLFTMASGSWLSAPFGLIGEGDFVSPRPAERCMDDSNQLTMILPST
jgi:hypothetical protein